MKFEYEFGNFRLYKTFRGNLTYMEENVIMKAIFPHSVLALDKIPELKIPEEIRGQVSSQKDVRITTRPRKVQSVLKRRQDPQAWPRNIVTKV